MIYSLDIQIFSVNILSSNFQLYKQVTTLSNQGHGYSIYSLVPISFFLTANDAHATSTPRCGLIMAERERFELSVPEGTAG